MEDERVPFAIETTRDESESLELPVDQLPPDKVIDRHPLLAAGAGQSSRRLPDAAVAPYCDALAVRFGFLADALARQQQAGQLSIAAAKAAQAFLHELRATLAVLALKHSRQLLNVQPVPLTIDPTESGMPTIKDFWALHDDRANAEEQLRQIPPPDAIIGQALDAIYAGQRPVKQQILWLQRAYMERLAATPVVTEFRQLDPLRLGKEDGDSLYAVSWTGIVRSLNLFECSTMHFVERGGWHVSGGIEDLRDLLDTVGTGRHALPEVVGLLNQAAWIVPRLIERVTIGPYHHAFTENDALIERAFAAATDAEPFLLEASIDRAATVRAASRSTLDKLFGREPMETGPAMRQRLLVAPLAIKQLLGTADEDHQPATVYGVSNNGELV